MIVKHFKSCRCANCKAKNICDQEQEENEKMLKSVYEDEHSKIFFYIFTSILLGIFIGYFWHYCSTQPQINKLKKQNELYQIQYDTYINSPEKMAIDKCSTEDYWRADCLAWELNNNNDTNTNAN
jgi:hypothetical protein